jgi:hypothetical protein
MDRDKLIQHLAAMTDDEFHQTAAQARTLSAARTVDDRLAAAQQRGDLHATIALKQEKHRHDQAARAARTTEGPTQ